MLVMKFGGTSVGSTDAIKHVAGIIKSRLDRQPAVILSAMGKTTDKLVKLWEYAVERDKKKTDELLEEIIWDHHKVIDELAIGQDKLFQSSFTKGIDELKQKVDRILESETFGLDLYDALISMGEFFSTNIMAAVLRAMDIDSIMVDAREVMITDSNYSAARPDFEASKANVVKKIQPLMGQKVPIMQGFIGSDTNGRTTTLGRGGSDYSATLLGAMLGVDTVEIWSDVDGVLTADPSLVPEAQRIRNMTFQEAAELAYFGARVIHPSTLLPAIERDISVIILNSKNLEFEGTIIQKHNPVSEHEGRVKSIAYKEGLTVITVTSTRMLMAHGFMAKLFEIFDKYNTAVDLIATSEVSVSMTVDNAEHLDKIRPELEEFADVEVESEKAIVCCVGEYLKRTPGVAAQIFGLLKDVKIYVISMGGSDINMSFVIDEKDLPRVINSLHEHTVLQKA